jgi:cytochrome c oxidase subunit I+III
LVVIGLLGLVTGIIGWNWPEDAPTSSEEEAAFSEKHNIPVRPHGSQAVNRGGMWLFILLIGIALTCFLLSYFYIRLENPDWPIGNLPDPTLTWVGIGTLFILLNAGVLHWTLKQLHEDKQGRLRLGLGVAFLLEAAAAGLIIYDLSLLPFDWRINAYGSLFWTINGFLLLTLFCGIGMNIFTQAWAWQDLYNSQRFVPVENTAVFWKALVVVWLTTTAVLYLTPYRF